MKTNYNFATQENISLFFEDIYLENKTKIPIHLNFS